MSPGGCSDTGVVVCEAPEDCACGGVTVPVSVGNGVMPIDVTFLMSIYVDLDVCLFKRPPFEIFLVATTLDFPLSTLQTARFLLVTF